MSSPSSLRHTMCGVGCPVALQESVKFSPSRTTNCELSFLVIILGGTVREEKSYEVIFILKYLTKYLYQQLQSIPNDVSWDQY